MKKSITTIIVVCIFTTTLLSQNITNTLGTSGVFTIKDASTNYFTLTQSTGQVNILKTLRLENTTSSTTGIIFKGTGSFLHNYGTNNTFLGINSGNFTMTGDQNTAVGYASLFNNTSGSRNTAVGFYSLIFNTGGLENTAVGMSTLYANNIGSRNTAVGYWSLVYNTNGSDNTAVGLNSLYSNGGGTQNTAVGNYSLQSNNASYNTAVGYYSLYSNNTGTNNTALGWSSLQGNTTGNYNSAVGFSSLYTNTIGFQNSAFGFNSLFSNTTGSENSAFGNYSLNSNTTGNFNSAFGFNSLYFNTTGFQNTAVGHHSLQSNTGNYNTALGYNAGSTVTTGYNLTLLGIDANPSSGTANDQITLGNSFVGSLRCNVTTITALSDARDKKNISDLSLGLDFISKLKPRLFNWDRREWYDDNISDGTKMQESPTAGFIAQELDEVQTTENAEWLNLVLKDNPEKLEATPGNLLPIMVKAIQELKTENDELKTKNNELKDRLTKLEQMQNILAVEIEKMKSKDSEVKEVKLGEK